MELNIPFRLFASCIPVRGASRSIICDLQRCDFQFIPNDLYDILHQYNGTCIADLLEKFETEHHETIVEYFQFLEENEFIFFSASQSNYLPLNLDSDDPCVIENAIIDYSAYNRMHLRDLIVQLQRLQCRALQIRFFEEVSGEEYRTLEGYLEGSSRMTFELIMKFDRNFQSSGYYAEICSLSNVASVIVHSSPFDRKEQVNLEYVSQEIKDEGHCGFISPYYFTVGIEFFGKSVSHNNCLHKKVGIDRAGNIKNCPAMNRNFGNVNVDRLEDIVRLSEFKSTWSLNKDSISVCKDCEFRYICSDCRVNVDDDRDERSKPLYCSYDPYTATWGE